jgi:hypothetical protein
MITEERYLTFTRTDIVEAVRFALDKMDLGVPPGVVMDAKPTPEGGATLKIERLGGRIVDVPLPPSALGSVLILFAKQLRIPLPRKAGKEIYASGDGESITLHMSIITNATINPRVLTTA